jgi:putative methionine-R-sulfoxide reductase with GAF domain
MEFKKEFMGNMSMSLKRDVILLECENVKKELLCDFIGIAIQNQVGTDIKWHYVVGNRNGKFKHITVRFGKGIAGKVISSGAPMMLGHFPNNIYGKSIEYPIMLAEQLDSSYAVPLFLNEKPKGVLLVGHRSYHSFNNQEQSLVRQAGDKIEKYLQAQIVQILGGNSIDK